MELFFIYNVFPFITMFVGIFFYYRKKKLWLAPVVTMGSYMLIYNVYMLIFYSRFDLVSVTVEAINPFSIAYTVLATIIALMIKGSRARNEAVERE